MSELGPAPNRRRVLEALAVGVGTKQQLAEALDLSERQVFAALQGLRHKGWAFCIDHQWAPTRDGYHKAREYSQC